MCTVTDIPANDGVVFPVYVFTNGLATPSSINGHATADAANALPAPAAPGRGARRGERDVVRLRTLRQGRGRGRDTPMLSSTGSLSDALPTKQILTIPKDVSTAAQPHLYGRPFALPTPHHFWFAPVSSSRTPA